MTARRIVLAVFVLLLTGCGARVEQPQAERAPADAAGTEAAPADNLEPDHGVPDGAGVASAPAEEPSPEDSGAPHAEDGQEEAAPPDDAASEPGAGSDRRIALELETSPRCASVSDIIAVTIRTEPRAELSMIVAHSDGQPHGQMGFADANDEGLYVWRWVVRPEVPPGQATVLIQSWSADGERGGHETDNFVVAEPGGCR